VVIQAVAERLAANVRESDVVARLGGDEFAVLLVQADRAVATTKAEALADAVQREPVMIGDAPVTIRISYGLSEITENAEPEALMAQADRAMYGHKRARRTA
jgi:diguanylate cyclase (GGDEF)-like protein